MRSRCVLTSSSLLGLLLLTVSGWSDPATERDRPIVVISDLHLGPGLENDATRPFEDFRWTADLTSFLKAVRSRGEDRVDLVIAGDLFELWQHPTVECESPGGDEDLGCSAERVEAVAKVVLQAHQADLKELGEFARAGDNRLFVVPGNHDAALMLDRVWELVAVRIGASSQRVQRVASGQWVSRDQLVAVEHGHQIGADVNRFPDWPEVTRLRDGQEYMVRTWGENLVDRLFNPVEKEKPLIDNLQPVSASVKYQWKSQKVEGKAADIARFVMFNVFQTSLAQKVALAPEGTEPSEKPRWDVGLARSREHRLVIDALPTDDPLRQVLLSEDPAWADVRAQLDAGVEDPKLFREEEILALCDRIALLGSSDSTGGRVACTTTLGSALLQSLVPDDRVLGRYLAQLRKQYHQLQIFIFGHTHEQRVPRRVRGGAGEVVVANTGAFQRLLGEDTLLSQAAERKIEPREAFSVLTLEDIPACYPVVWVEYKNGLPEAKAQNWFVNPKDGKGEFVGACDTRCGYRSPASCRQ